jgi:hypothetical protein
MNLKLAIAVFVLPLGMSSSFVKSVSATEIAHQPETQTSIVVAQRYPDQWNNDQRYDNQGNGDRRDNNQRYNDRRNNDQRHNDQWNRDQQESIRHEESQQNEIRRDHIRQDQLRQGELRQDQDHWNQNRRDDQRVWIPGHYESGFLGIGRRWVEGYWATGR